MLRLVTSVGSCLLIGVSVFAQMTKYYTLDNSSSYDTVNFYLKASASNCLFSKSLEDAKPLIIYGNPNPHEIKPTFASRIQKGICYSNLTLDKEGSGLTRGLTLAMSKKMEENDYWKINFSDEKIYRLNFNYGFGSADLNLSGSSVEKLKVKSGSADIIVGYDEGYENQIAMDTFFVKADFGSIIANRIQSMNARKVITKVGFGNVFLDFNQRLVKNCSVSASVGAGNLEVSLPKDHTPVIIYVKDSPLCSIKIPDGFEEVEDNVFVNMYYSTIAQNVLSFDIDVALGTVSFKHANK